MKKYEPPKKSSKDYLSTNCIAFATESSLDKHVLFNSIRQVTELVDFTG